MKSKLIKNLELCLRIIGGDIVILLIGIMELVFGRDAGGFITKISLVFILCVTGLIIKRDLNIESDIAKVATIYIICRGVINIFLITNLFEFNLIVFVMIIEALWIARFYLPKKESM